MSKKRVCAERRMYVVGGLGDERGGLYAASEPREAVHRWCEAHTHELRASYQTDITVWTDWGQPNEHVEGWTVDLTQQPAWLISPYREEENEDA